MQKYPSVSSELHRDHPRAVRAWGNAETERFSGCAPEIHQLGEKLLWKTQAEFKRVPNAHRWKTQDLEQLQRKPRPRGQGGPP